MSATSIGISPNSLSRSCPLLQKSAQLVNVWKPAMNIHCTVGLGLNAARSLSSD